MILSLFATFIASFIALKLFITFSNQLGIIDIPNERSVHIKAIPSGSGIAIFLSVFFILVFTYSNEYQHYSLSIIGVLLVFLLGVYDDLRGAVPLYKVIIIAVGTLFLCLDGLMITNLGTYFGYPLIMLSWLSVPFTIIAVVGFTNALNLIDGLDGLAASISIVIFSSFWFVGSQNNDQFLLLTSPIIISALVVFLVFNWNPAKLFMGDSGSLTLGFVISIMSIKSINYIEPVIILYLLAIPIIDTIVVMIRRKRSKRPIFFADKQHIHHIFFNIFKEDVKKTVIFITLIQVSYTAFGLIVVVNMPYEMALLLYITSLMGWYILLNKLSQKFISNTEVCEKMV